MYHRSDEKLKIIMGKKKKVKKDTDWTKKKKKQTKKQKKNTNKQKRTSIKRKQQTK